MKPDLERFRVAYEVLRPNIPDAPGEREWFDRLRSWEDFIELGPIVAEVLRMENPWEPEQPERLRAMYPEMADLILRAFPAS